MGQVDVYKYFQKLRKNKKHGYYSISEIHKMLSEEKIYCGNRTSVRRCIVKLYEGGFLDSVQPNDILNWTRLFRLKDEYIK